MALASVTQVRSPEDGEAGNEATATGSVQREPTRELPEMVVEADAAASEPANDAEEVGKPVGHEHAAFGPGAGIVSTHSNGHRAVRRGERSCNGINSDRRVAANASKSGGGHGHAAHRGAGGAVTFDDVPGRWRAGG